MSGLQDAADPPSCWSHNNLILAAAILFCVLLKRIQLSLRYKGGLSK